MSSRTRTYCPNCYERYAPRDVACPACGRVRDEKSIAEMIASGQAGQEMLVWAWSAAGILGLLFAAIWLTRSPHVPPSPHPPVVYLPTPEERVALARRKADDTKFWAAKEKREAAEVAGYSADKAGTDTAQTLTTPPTGSGSQNETIAITGVDVFVPAGTPNPPGSSGTEHPTGGSQGTLGATL